MAPEEGHLTCPLHPCVSVHAQSHVLTHTRVRTHSPPRPAYSQRLCKGLLKRGAERWSSAGSGEPSCSETVAKTCTLFMGPDGAQVWEEWGGLPSRCFATAPLVNQDSKVPERLSEPSQAGRGRSKARPLGGRLKSP